MRAEILYPFFAEIKSIKGVGDVASGNLAKLGITRVKDLLFHKPIAYIDRTKTPKIFEAEIGVPATFKLEVYEHIKPPRSHMPYRVICGNSTGIIDLVFFHYKNDYFKNLLPVGEVRLISGTLEKFGEKYQISHPDFIAPLAKKNEVLIYEAQYPLTFGLSHKMTRKLITEALKKIPQLPEWQHGAKISFTNALNEIHHPKTLGDETALKRISYDEILAGQIAKALMHKQVTHKAGAKILGLQNIDKLKHSLPYKLTDDQQHSLAEIQSDMASGKRMFRLLQGDVGSGKTIVAVLAAVAAAESGFQSVFMMPTTLLAIQQKHNIEELTKELGLRVELLTSAEKGKKREDILSRLKTGKIDILIGTHALVQDWVQFKNLGLAIIDEQHRFGVLQRLKLTAKNEKAHILLMTATPIPRTLTLAIYGEMEISYIRQKPSIRKEIATYVMSNERIDEIKQNLQRAINAGEKIFWICPLVEESEKSDLAAAKDRYIELKAQFGNIVGLVHGRMKEQEKDETLQKFLHGEYKILVATTVIEVGINVPDATIMFIEHAERFGLSQLHQLRGRVGRGDKESKCILLYSGKPTERLKIIKSSTDGFVIAEEDLKLRGSGDVLGTRQSGFAEFKFAEFPRDIEILERARTEAINLVKYNKLTKNHELLLSLFEFDESLDYISAG